MTKEKSSALWFVFIPALAMWLGWGVRGLFGHANGAMFPGAMVALAVCYLLKGKRLSVGLVVAMTAIGYGFGADETTLQTAGYLSGGNITHLVKLGIAYPGLALKGGLWAMFGGMGLGLALVAYRYSKRDIAIGALLLVGFFYAGWYLINRPQLIYFSLDRKEIWAGLLFGGVALLTWLTVRGRTPIPLRLAGWAALGGAIGYPIAVTLSSLGRHSTFAVGHDWWKVAETTFGAFQGAGIGLGTYYLKPLLPDRADALPENPVPVSHSWIGALVGAAGAALANTLYSGVMVGGTSRGFHNITPWILLGPILWCVAFFWHRAAWQLGVTMTFFATAVDLLLHWRNNEQFGITAIVWVVVALATVILAWRVTGWWAEADADVPRRVFLSLMWAFLVMSYLLLFTPRAVIHAPANVVALAGGWWPYFLKALGGGVGVGVGFTVAALILAWCLRPLSEAPKSTPEIVGNPRAVA